jgi:choline dehydrogenase-like flavoprotein
MTEHEGAHGEHGDMLVIGSLFGGSVAALELKEKGDSLCISAASTDSESAASAMPTVSSSNTTATIYSITERAWRS